MASASSQSASAASLSIPASAVSNAPMLDMNSQEFMSSRERMLRMEQHFRDGGGFTTGIKLPWETGLLSFSRTGSLPMMPRMPHLQWAGLVPPLPRAAMTGPAALAPPPKAAEKGPLKKEAEGGVFQVAVKKARLEKTPGAEDAQKRAFAIDSWSRLIWRYPFASAVGQQASGDSAGATTIADAFATKQTSTLLARYYSITQFENWAVTFQDGAQPWPFDEGMAYEYTSHLARVKAPASRATRFVQAVNFCHGTLGVDGAQEVSSSKRISGSAWRQFGNKRLLS